jgi:hypothetical protein
LADAGRAPGPGLTRDGWLRRLAIVRHPLPNVIALLALALLAAGCRAAPPPTVSPSPPEPLPQVLRDVDVLAPLAILDSYRVSLNVTRAYTRTGGEQLFDSAHYWLTIEVERPAAARHVINLLQRIGPTVHAVPSRSEFYFIAGTTYVLDSTQRPASCAIGSAPRYRDPAALLGDFARIPEARLVARGEYVSGRLSDHYRVTVPAGPRSGLLGGEADVWITAAEGHVVQYVGGAQCCLDIGGRLPDDRWTLRFDYRLEAINQLPPIRLPEACSDALSEGLPPAVSAREQSLVPAITPVARPAVTRVRLSAAPAIGGAP